MQFPRQEEGKKINDHTSSLTRTEQNELFSAPDLHKTVAHCKTLHLREAARETANNKP